LCVNDICLIARLLDDSKLLPRATTFSEFVEVDKTYQFNWFWCQVFPKTPPTFAGHDQSVIFSGKMELNRPDDGQGTRLPTETANLVQLADSFEYFLEQRRKYNQLKEWYDLITTQANQLVMNELEYFGEHPKIAVSTEIRQMIHVSGISTELLIRHQSQLREFAHEWDQVVARSQEGRDLKVMLRAHDSARKVMWDAIRMIRSISKAPLARSFRVLMDALLQFKAIMEHLALGDKFMVGVLAQLPGGVMLIPFMLFNGTVIRDPTFVMSEEEKLVWVKFEACILLTLKDNPELMLKIVSTQDELAFRYGIGAKGRLPRPPK
jgi:hypothetical protein